MSTRRSSSTAAAGWTPVRGAGNSRRRRSARRITAAKAAGKDVYVAAGTYPETLGLESNVSIYGGYTPSFAQRIPAELTTIVGSPQAVLADNDSGVVLQLLTLQGAVQAVGGSSYGLRAINDAKIALDHVTAQGGAAGPGAAGLTGGFNGTAVRNGTIGNSGNCSATTAGPAGGVGAGFNGGLGGSGSRDR